MTVFIWTPRIGSLASSKDKDLQNHYQTHLDRIKWQMQEPPLQNEIPRIRASFSNWEPKTMRDVVKFCQNNDPNPPDFVKDCVYDGLVQPTYDPDNLDSLTKIEKNNVQERSKQYYSEHWHRVLLTMLRYESPSIASVD